MTDFDLSKISIFSNFPDNWLVSLQSIFNSIKRKQGDVLITEGDQGDELYVLVKGRVRITKSMLIKGLNLPILETDNPRKVLATLDATDYPIFGEMALLDRDQRSATIKILEDSEFLVTDRDLFFKLTKNNPDLGCHLLAVLGKRMTATIRRNNSELIKLSTALALSLSRIKKGI